MHPFCHWENVDTLGNKKHMFLLHTYAAHVKQNIFEQELNKVYSLLDNASFGIFCIKIGRLFESHCTGSLKAQRRFDTLEEKLMLKKNFLGTSKTQCDSSNQPILT